MFLLDVIQYLLNSEIAVCGEANDYCMLCLEQVGYCPATAFTSIAAAFATQGYWVQADLLDMLTFSNFGTLAPLLYVISAIGGLIGVAIGTPPRTYMWFFLGPALYAWLIGTRVEVNGVQWQVGLKQQEQREVWKMAEVGLLNTNMARRMDDWGGGANITSTEAPEAVEVSNFFLWYDSLISSVVNALIDWIGPYNLRASQDVFSSNIWGTGILGSIFGAGAGSDTVESSDRWFLLSNLKWAMLEDITSAKLTSPVTRDAFATFMGGICGEQLTRAIDETAFIQAANAKSGATVPDSIFRKFEGEHRMSSPGDPNSMEILASELRQFQTDYTGSPLRELFNNRDAEGSFYQSLNWGAGEWLTGNDPTSKQETIRCDTYLMLMILAFRYEAGQIYAQMVNNSPDISYDAEAEPMDKARRLVYNLFYGWDIKKEREYMFGLPSFGSGNMLTSDREAQAFLTDLILIHVIKNEFSMVAHPVDVRFTGSRLTKSYSDGSISTTGSKGKFGELYTWAIMMPYLQGVLMYYLAMAYPIACLLMIVPGWHKALFTWGSFWAWVKLWDVGFAVVMSIERSVWAMIGNSSHAATLHDKVLDLQKWGAAAVNLSNTDSWGRQIPEVVLHTSLNGGKTGLDWETLVNNLRILDRAMTIAPSMDLDISNSYYIYIMAALYLAVPGITGQLVLGAKAGMAGALTQGIGSAAERAGGAAGAGYTSDLTQALRANQESVGQAAKAAHYQRGGLAASVLEASNAQSMMGIQGQAIQSRAAKANNVAQGESLRAQQYGQVGQMVKAGINAAAPALGGGGGAAQLNGALQIPNDGLMANKQLGAISAQQASNLMGYMANGAGFEAKATESALGAGTRMMQARTQFGAEQAAFRAQNRMGAQLDGWASARGVSAGMLGGQKTSGFEGLAASGLSGQEAKDQASMFDPFGFNGGGGVYSDIASTAANLSSAADQPWTGSAPSVADFNNEAWSKVGSNVSAVIGKIDPQGEIVKSWNNGKPAGQQVSTATEALGRARDRVNESVSAIFDPSIGPSKPR